ncbi:MAG TPA: single-stranded-DNA-specific exonuclease RecJ [Steroidobacteraceae bacterium]|nr:single-stranded-DNA-specific exonuclease RecJ [Steroidobacteraceae bacterium]
MNGTARIERRVAAAAATFSAALNPVLRRVYAARGLRCDHDLDLSLAHLLPVGSLAGAAEAAALLAAHRTTGCVLIVGDFDADGATSSALMVRALRALGFAQVDFLVPDRFRFGYGLTPQIVARAAQLRPSLIVTVDNGVSSIDGVAAARALGIAVLVTDHHLPGAELPAADAIVNPNLRSSTFASPALAGVGVAFYVIAALARSLPQTGFNPAQLLDLVALGTVADVVPLDRNNRILVAQGLRRIRSGRCVAGVRALLAAGSRRLEEVSAADLGFAAAPRLNAAGRIADMRLGIECLLADSADEAAALAARLSALNEERREIERRMQLEAIDIAAAMRASPAGESALGLCLFDASWHQGVVGLVAGRIKERLHRPVVAFAVAADGSLRGSARSIPGVHVRDALEAISVRHPGLIDQFGGHAMAAGLTLRPDKLEAFRTAFAAEVAGRADPATLAGVILSDGELSPAELSLETARALAAGGPWGQGFAEPVFDGEFEICEARVVGERHLKLKLRPAPAAANGARRVDSHAAFDAIAFGFIDGAAAAALPRAGARVAAAYQLEANEWNGRARLQLNCRHLRVI